MATQNFKDNEFGCKHCGKFIENTELKAVLELVRLKFGGIVTITSGTRCRTHNKNVGGASRSQHLLGTAADIACSKASPREVYDYLCDTFPDYYGIAAYISKGFCHVDVRTKYWRKVNE